MSAQIRQVSRADVLSMIEHSGLTPKELSLFDRCLLVTTQMWVGLVGDDFVCTWGIVPPTFMSDRAYLWLYTTEAVKDFEFIFVRNSQRVIQDLLKTYPVIVGHVHVEHLRSIRWLKWLGAELCEAVEAGGKPMQLIPFVIRQRNG